MAYKLICRKHTTHQENDGLQTNLHKTHWNDGLQEITQNSKETMFYKLICTLQSTHPGSVSMTRPSSSASASTLNSWWANVSPHSVILWRHTPTTGKSAPMRSPQMLWRHLALKMFTASLRPTCTHLHGDGRQSGASVTLNTHCTVLRNTRMLEKRLAPARPAAWRHWKDRQISGNSEESWQRFYCTTAPALPALTLGHSARVGDTTTTPANF
jgi:hypothetical protein